jgi:2-keto-3-deoxy-L-rhamnonate aldolase
VLSLGCAGTIDGAAGFFPRSVVFLYKLSIKENPSQEDIRERTILQYIISSVEELVVKYGTVGIKEATSRILGFGDRDGTRLPLCGGIPGGDEEWENWKGIIGDLEAVEKRLPMK